MTSWQAFGVTRRVFSLVRRHNGDVLKRCLFSSCQGVFLIPSCSVIPLACRRNLHQIQTNLPYNSKIFLYRCYSTENEKPKLGLADQILANKIASEQAEKKSEKEDQKEDDKKREPMPKWQKYAYLFFGVTFGGSLIANAVLFSMPDQDQLGNVIEDEYSSLPFPSQNYNRLKNKIFTTKKAIEEPFSDKLLPDPLEPPYYQPKYTIVIELTGLLVHSNWTQKHGWRFQKRPGLDMFLSQIGYPNFELVVWTVENSTTFFPILLAMDPEQKHVMYKLFKDATKYQNGQHIKELSNLNRDMRKVIVIDWNKDHIQHNPDSALILKKWEGDNSDRSLIGLTQLLHEIKDSEIDDVRDVLTYYKQFDDPIEAFRENQRRLAEEMRVQEEMKKKEKENTRFTSVPGLSGFSLFRR